MRTYLVDLGRRAWLLACRIRQAQAVSEATKAGWAFSRVPVSVHERAILRGHDCRFETCPE